MCYHKGMNITLRQGESLEARLARFRFELGQCFPESEKGKALAKEIKYLEHLISLHK